MTKHTPANTVRLATVIADARTLGLCNQANALILAWDPSDSAAEQAKAMPAIQEAIEAIGGADGYRDEVEAIRMATLRELHTILGRMAWVLAA